jgi:hypothetical protein
VGAGVVDFGCVIVLTNISALWRVPARATTAMDAAFRLHEGTRLSGLLEWGSSGRQKGAVSLTGVYDCTWRDYSELAGAEGAAVFRYACLAAGPPDV